MARHLALILAAALALPAAALAAPTAEEARQAILLADQADEQYAARRYAEAYALFRRASNLVPSPTMSVRMADCRRNLGQLVKARALYREVATWQLPTPSPPPYVKAKERAQHELSDLERRIPTLEIAIAGAPAEDVVVSVDGDQLATAERSSLRLDPGKHAVVGTLSGAAPLSRDVVLAEGASERVVLIFEPEPAISGGADTAVATVLPWVFVTVGGAALAVGAITGVATLNKAAEIEDECGGTTNCDPALELEVDNNKTLGNVSTAMFIVGGALSAAGVVLLVVDVGGGAAHVALGAGATGVVLTGMF